MRLNPSALLLLLLACCNSLPTLEGIDVQQWKEDKNGCGGLRQSMNPALRAEAQKLKGLSEMDVITLLGRPDQNELYERNQKFYYYFLAPGPGCSKPDSTAQRLILRFNALGYAQLVSIE